MTSPKVGYGDKKPETLEGRLFAIFFVLLGFSILAYGFSLAATFALEKAETMKVKHETRVQSLLTKVADMRLPSLSGITKRLSRKPTITPPAGGGGEVEGAEGLDLGEVQVRSIGGRSGSGSGSADSRDDYDEGNVMLRDLEAGDSSAPSSSSSFDSVSQLSDAYQKSFQWETYKLKRRCIRNLALILAFMLVASLVMMAQEGWTFSDSVYWAVVSGT
jgi:hypothetical protein